VSHRLAHQHRADLTAHSQLAYVLKSHAEALMLIALFAGDQSVITDPEDRRPVTLSPALRRFAPAELRISPRRPVARRVRVAVQHHESADKNRHPHRPRHQGPERGPPIIAVTAEAFRGLLTRETAFIHSGGDRRAAAPSRIDPQQAIDRIMAR